MFHNYFYATETNCNQDQSGFYRKTKTSLFMMEVVTDSDPDGMRPGMFVRDRIRQAGKSDIC